MIRAQEDGPWPDLVIDVGRLGQRDNLTELKRRGASDSSREISIEVEANDLKVTTSRIPEGSKVRVEGVIDSAMDGVEFNGAVTSSWEGECRRCLKLISEPLHIDLSVSFLPDLSEEDDAEAYPLSGDFINLGEVVREELMLALPLSPVCPDQCDESDMAGYSVITEADRSNQDGDERPIDPRWAGLSALTFDEE